MYLQPLCTSNIHSSQHYAVNMSTTEICSTFIEGAPPGELSEVVNDIKALTSDDDPSLIEKLKPAFQQYNEEQLLAVKLPGAADPVHTITPYRLTRTNL